MITETEDAIEDDVDSNELFDELYDNDQDVELTRLTEMVRKHYLNYLEKQLQENLLNSNFNKNKKKNSIQRQKYDEETHRMFIKKTAELLEDKALKACMIAKFYQRAMVKIIAIVRRTTQEKRLLTYLEKCIQSKDENENLTSSKETQTEAEIIDHKKTIDNESLELGHTPEKQIMSLDEKIEMFQKHLHIEKCNDVAKKYPQNSKQRKMIKRQYKNHNHYQQPTHYQRRHHDGHHCKEQGKEIYFSPASSSVITVRTSPISPILQAPAPLEDNKNTSHVVMENENSNDSVALELARLFSEEKTELDEIFGINPNDEPDDPQICKILKEIEDAKLSHTNQTDANILIQNENPSNETFHSLIEPKSNQPVSAKDLCQSIDLSKSIWPCELFMQRRKLSESLARLIEEDLRWHDIMKWKFSQLFGEDSDDEFTPCSPSIELNEVLVGSCIRRISPWVVKHLMKPMKDGLIGNRFLFKKLAKTIARSIVMENQYPDEYIIKECVENFFCLHQAVMSLDDLDVDIPSVSSF
ncbi:uncharacterized protein ACRADG_000178 isoform 1-T3 [Cochliomyia hominivorax]